jgi:hypothetical protein
LAEREGFEPPSPLPGEPDFELPNRQRRQPQTKTSSEKQLSPTLAFVSLCRLLSVDLSQFFHSQRKPGATAIKSNKEGF